MVAIDGVTLEVEPEEGGARDYRERARRRGERDRDRVTLATERRFWQVSAIVLCCPPWRTVLSFRRERGSRCHQYDSEEAWQVRAACRGPQSSVFFPPAQFERKEEKLAREHRAKAICAQCPVRQPCLQYALKIREPHGIWGGLNEVERKQLLAQQGA